MDISDLNGVEWNKALLTLARGSFCIFFKLFPLHSLHFLLFLGMPVSHFIVCLCFILTWGMFHLFVLALSKKLCLLPHVCILEIQSVGAAANPYLVIFVKAAEANIKLILL